MLEWHDIGDNLCLVGVGENMYLPSTWADVVTEILRAIDIANAFGARASERYRSVMNNLTPQQERAVAGFSAVAFNLLLLTLLFVGLRTTIPTVSQEFEMTLGGPAGVQSNTPKPPLIMPQLPTLPPPLVQSDMTLEGNTASPAGSPNTSTPAQAIAAEHAFPPLPAELKSGGPKLVRLVVTITEEGVIADASVQVSSGISALDNLAVAWVTSHWHYIPAMRDGRAIAVTTTAVVSFASM